MYRIQDIDNTFYERLVNECLNILIMYKRIDNNYHPVVKFVHTTLMLIRQGLAGEKRFGLGNFDKYTSIEECLYILMILINAENRNNRVH